LRRSPPCIQPWARNRPAHPHRACRTASGGSARLAELGYEGSMQELFSVIYLWLKAGHIIFVIFWMAGLFILPRQFIYHQECAPGSPENATWIDRERKLLHIILWPSLMIVWLLGIALAMTIGAFSQGWF